MACGLYLRNADDVTDSVVKELSGSEDGQFANSLPLLLL